MPHPLPPAPPLQAGLGDVFLSPLGLAAAALAVPIVLLYMIKPDPEERRLPTLRFLAEEAGTERTNPFVSRLRRNLLLALQVLVVLALALALASPYVTVAQRESVAETVLVVDASASMATESGGQSRFARAVAAARDDVTGRTTVVRGAGDASVVVRGASGADARAALSDLRRSDAPGSLRAAVAAGTAVAGEDARVVVYSDFADDSDWTGAVREARARGLSVALEQVAPEAGAGNVGIVERRIEGTEVTFAVRNFGDSRATRTLEFGGASRDLTLGPGDVVTETLPLPAGGATARLAPGDAFGVDDVVPVAAPRDRTVDVLLVTSDESRYLRTALGVIDAVETTVATPPTTVEREYDVIVYGDVDGDLLLRGTVEAGRETVERGGGVAVVAQRSPPDRLGDLLLVAPQSVGTSPTINATVDHPITRGIAFTPPGEYLAGPLREGRALVELSDGSPLIATADRGAGRLLYYGYVESASSFRFYYQYPVFWKRAIFHLAGRDAPETLNRRTGDQWAVGAGTAASTPTGRVTAASVPLESVGVYEAGDRRIAAALLDESESRVAAAPLSERTGPDAVPAREERRRVPRPLTDLLALAAVLGVVGEVAFLRYRGDL